MNVDATPASQPDEVDAVLAAARVLVALSARSLAAVEDEVTLPQLRVLVMVASRRSLNVGAIATELGVHPSNATRTVDRLVGAGLLDRREDPTDRRHNLLQLTEAGTAFVDRVMDHRRDAVAAILAAMPAARRRALVPVLTAFATAGGEAPDSDVWALGWTTA